MYLYTSNILDKNSMWLPDAITLGIPDDRIPRILLSQDGIEVFHVASGPSFCVGS